MEENKNNTPVTNPAEGPMVETPTMPVQPVMPEAPAPVAPTPVVEVPMAGMESTPVVETVAPTPVEVKPEVVPAKKKRTALVVIIVLLIVAVLVALPFLFKTLGIIDIF